MLNQVVTPNGEYMLIKTNANAAVKRIRRTMFFRVTKKDGMGLLKSMVHKDALKTLIFHLE